MALRAQKPSEVQKRFKALIYGAAGVGKSYTAIQFPSPYLIDTERGCENAQYTKILEEKNGAIFQTNDFNEIFKEVRSLITEKHHYKTLIIDSITPVYEIMLDEAAQKLSKNGKDGTEMGRHYSEANKQLKRLFNMLYRLDMNVIITSHPKPLYGPNMTIIGSTFDCYRKMDHVFDLALEVQKKGSERVALVVKTRVSSFLEGQTFKFSYDEISTRHGKDVIEKRAEPKSLSSADQLEEMKYLIDALRVPDEIIDKWLSKAECSCFEDMDSSVIQKCIDNLRAKLEEREYGPNGTDRVVPIMSGAANA